MWNMPSGIQKIEGNLKTLFLESAYMLAEDIYEFAKAKPEDPFKNTYSTWFSTNMFFDSMLEAFRIYALRYVADMLTNDAPAPMHSAWMESAIAATFKYFAALIDLEIDGMTGRRLDDRWKWSKMLYAAAVEEGLLQDCKECSELADNGVCPSCGKPIPPPSAEEWLQSLDKGVATFGYPTLLDLLSDVILWDRDWEMVDTPEAAAKMHERPKAYLPPDYGKEWLKIDWREEPEEGESMGEKLSIPQDYHHLPDVVPEGNPSEWLRWLQVAAESPATA